MGKKILIVDDEPDVAKVVELRLKIAGYEVAVAANGKEAIEKAETEKPDLILLDYFMPDILGDQVVKSIKEKEACQSIPILLITASLAVTQKLIGNMGVVDFIVKPISPEVLLEKVKKALGE